MLIRTLASSALLAALVVASPVLADDDCGHKDSRGDAKPVGNKSGVLTRGEKLQGLQSVKFADLMAAPEKFQDKSIRLEGTVRKACTKAGCWMELAESASKDANGVRVTMKDNSFFVPTDSAGFKATVEGSVKVKVLSEEDAKHYESEGGTVPRTKDGTAREVRMVAAGIELVRS